MRKYFLFLSAFIFVTSFFFIVIAQNNLALALKAGDKCIVAQGCGASTLVCVPQCVKGPIGTQDCSKGTCIAKTKTSGSCSPSASVCAPNYSCLQSSCKPNPPGVPGCTPVYTCQAQQVGPGKDCKGAGGQGNCQKGYACLADPKNPSTCGTISNPTPCRNICQKQGQQNQSCTGPGSQGSCASGLICEQVSCKQGPLGVPECTNKCLPRNGKPGQDCKPTGSGTGQGTCSNGYLCLLDPKNPPNCGTIANPAVCNYTCQSKGSLDDPCTGTGQGTCAAGLACVPDMTKCQGVGLGQFCPSFCKTPQAPSNPPMPPSPPCMSWSNGQCQTFATAFGNFSTNPSGFIKTIFDILLSISGGIALLLIIKAGYQLMTSQGKPEQIQQGRDQLIAAIVGLVFLIFSFVILQVIGFDILRIPGFGQ